MSYKVIAYPDGAEPVEPISVEEARAHCEAIRYGESDVDPLDDEKFEAWITAAREYCEDFLGLALVPKEIEWAYDSFPAGRCGLGVAPRDTALDFPVWPVRGLVFVGTGDPQTTDFTELDSEGYVLDDFGFPPNVRAVGSWPSLTASPNNVRVRALVGFGADSDGGEPVPKVIRQAMLLMVGHFYANREDSIDVALQSIPNGAMDLMRPRRVRKGMA